MRRRDLERLQREASAAGLVPLVPQDVVPWPSSEREIAALERIIRGAGFSDAMIAERVGYWRRRLAVQFAIDNTRLEGGTVSPGTHQRMEDWAEGRITDDELMSGVLAETNLERK